MTRRAIPIPLGGLSEAASLEAQPYGTVPVTRNMRSEDPISGRLRLSSREGTAKHNTTRISTSKIQHAASVMFDRRTQSYAPGVHAAPGDLSRWAVTMPSKKECLNGVIDRQGNTWAIDGNAALVKFNSAGAEVQRVTLPVADDGHVVREIEIDEFDRLYLAVSSGGSMSGARMWCYVPDVDTGLRKLWQVNLGLYVERLFLKDGRLHVALANTEGARGYARIYEDITSSTGPTLLWSHSVPYPVGDLGVDQAGFVFTTHEPNATRGIDPRVPDSSVIFDEMRWNPWTHLDQFEARIWGGWRAGDIKKQFGYSSIQDGGKILEWRSSYGRKIPLFADSRTPTGGGSYKAPTYREHSIGFKPGVHWDGNYFRLISQPSIGGTVSANEINGTLLPGKGKGYVIFVLVKVSEETAKMGRLFAQMNSKTGNLRELYVNTSDAGATPASGHISVTNTPLTGTNPSSVNGQFDNKNSVALITMLCDNEALGTGNQFSVWRVNGVPVAKWTQNEFFTNSGLLSYLGCKDDGTYGPILDIAELWVFQSYDDNGIERVMSAPQYDANQAGPNPAYDPASYTEVELMEGWLMHGRGMAHLLDDGALAADSAPTWNSEGGHSEYCHPCTQAQTAVDSTFAPPNPNGKNADTLEADLVSARPLTVALSTRGNVVAVSRASGQGYGLVCVGDDRVVTIGPRIGGATSGANANTLRMQRFNGSVFSINWQYPINDGGGLAIDPTATRLRLDTDEFNNVYVPFHWGGAGTLYSLLIYDFAGVQLLAYAALNTELAHAVKVDQRIPDYGSPIDLAEYISLFTGNSNLRGHPTLHRVRLVNSSPAANALRQSMSVAVANGQVFNYDAGLTVNVIGSGLDANAKYICSSAFGGRLYFVDGSHKRVLDPKRTLVGEWASTTPGELPRAPQLVDTWRGRMVLARFDGEPQNVFMTEVGNPTGCDLNPPVATSKQAWIGNMTQGPGLVPDIVNALVPYDRERLIFGCDHSLHVLHGDPMEGGSITLLSDITGMSFGPSWCKDAAGVVYFFGSRGGVYRLTPAGVVDKISSSRGRPGAPDIDRRLQDIDLESFYAQLLWDEEYHCLRVFILPYGPGGTVREHYNWNSKTGAWNPDTFFVPNVQPSCAFVMDGDLPRDRTLVFGREDGYMGRYSRTAKSDDGYPIDALVRMGGFVDDSGRLRLGNVGVTLASEQDGAWFDLLTGESADQRVPEVIESWIAHPGENEIHFGHAAGAAVWIQARNAAVGQRFAIERLACDVTSIGRRAAGITR